MFRIAILDDHDDTRSLLRLWLEDKYEVSDYAAPEPLIADLSARDFHLLLLDLRLPMTDGFEVVQAIRKIPSRPRPAIIALTASAFNAEKERAREVGFDDVLTKPIDLERLNGTIRKYLH